MYRRGFLAFLVGMGAGFGVQRRLLAPEPVIAPPAPAAPKPAPGLDRYFTSKHTWYVKGELPYLRCLDRSGYIRTRDGRFIPDELIEDMAQDNPELQLILAQERALERGRFFAYQRYSEPWA